MITTISISSYNQAEYLKEAIESALAQSDTQTVPCEILVIDDGSTDNSLEIARSYEPRIKVISQVNKGLSSARNTGLLNSNPYGEYILFLDSDDILLPNCVERIEQEIEKTGADIIAPSFKCFGKGDDTIILMPNPTIEDFKVANRIGYASAIKREKLLEVGGYSPKMIFGYEDLHLWFNLLSRGAIIATIPEVLWLYRTKEKSMWHDALLHHEEMMTQIHKDFPQIINIINDPLPK